MHAVFLNFSTSVTGTSSVKMHLTKSLIPYAPSLFTNVSGSVLLCRVSVVIYVPGSVGFGKYFAVYTRVFFF